MIKIENVSYSYNLGRPDEVRALSDVSAVIEDGKITAVIGNTGSGKTTLIQLLNGLEKPCGGKIFIDGEDITDKKTNLRKLRFKVGMVFQFPENQLFEETVEKDIAFGPSNMGLDKAQIKRRVKRAAALAGLNDGELKKSPFELSGGKKRRAAIAGVLAMEPEIIIMDEPAAGLDPAGRRSVFEIIEKLHRERPEITVIFVSHSMEDVARTADKVIVMENGRVIMSGAPEEIFSHHAKLKNAGLDIPQSALICEKLRRAGLDIAENIYTPEKLAAQLKRILKHD